MADDRQVLDDGGCQGGSILVPGGQLWRRRVVQEKAAATTAANSRKPRRDMSISDAGYREAVSIQNSYRSMLAEMQRPKSQRRPLALSDRPPQMA